MLPFATEIERGPGRPKKGYFCEDGGRVASASTIASRYMSPEGLYRGHWWNGMEGRSYGDWGKGDALGIGTLVHSIIEAEINEEPIPGVPAEMASAVESAVGAWHDWFLMNELRIVATEIPLVSEQHRFGGTLDTIVEDRHGRLALGDWKTSKALYPNYLWQIAAYRILWNECRDEPLTGGFHLVRFGKEHGDLEHRYFAELDDAEELFLLFAKAYRIDREVSRRLK
jgi:hypothetical protein